MYEEAIYGMNKISLPGVCDLDMNTVTVLGDHSPLPIAKSGKMLLVYAPGSFTGGNLDGRLLIFFRVFIY